MGAGQLLFGTDEPVAPALLLHAGRLSARLRGTRLGPVCYDGHEVWHGVDFLFRDADWGTPAPVVDVLSHENGTQGFRVRLQGHIDAGERIGFEILIEAGDEMLRYDVTARPDGDLHTNRTGIVVMHPLAVCGRPVEVVHIDGRTSASTFPTLVAPWPPFTLVGAIRHAYQEGAWACCSFAGCDFELEDQRNNADASFKTYSRSNLMPRPYRLRTGAELRQSVALRIESPPARPLPPQTGPVQVSVGASAAALPAIGTAICGADLHAAAPQLRAALGALAPALLHLALDTPDEPLEAEGLACLLADAGGCALRLDIAGVDPARADPQLARIAAALRAAGAVPDAVAVFPSAAPVVEAARRAFPRSRIGGGTPHFFTQLNRIEDLGPSDFLAFTTSSVVHGADDEEIMSGLRSLPAMVQTLACRHGPVPVHVGPSSIGARRSPLGGQPASDGTRRLALARRDPRTHGLFGAAWALGYVAQFAQAGAQAITLFSLQGDAALVDGGARTPAFELLRRLGAPARCRDVTVSDPGSVAVLALERAGGSETLLANLRGETVDVVLSGVVCPPHAQVMDASSLPMAGVNPEASFWRPEPVRDASLRLAPYALACV
jgi:hypothetical protein